jgi:cobalt/nickel transport protein
MSTIKKLWIGLGILIVLSPIGLILPDRFMAGSAWGEWGSDEMKELVGYIPKGLEKLSSLWNAPMPDYAFKGWEEKGLSQLSLAYIVSAIAGIAIIVIAVMFIGKLLARKGDQ